MKDANNGFLKLIQNMDEDFKLRMAIYVCFAAACVVILLLLWLLLRGFRLWYWKVDVRIDKLSDIEQELKGIRNALDGPPVLGRYAAGRMPAEAISAGSPAVCGVGADEGTGDSKSEVQEEKPRKGKYKARDCNVSKSGKIYTEDKLELQIKD